MNEFTVRLIAFLGRMDGFTRPTHDMIVAFSYSKAYVQQIIDERNWLLEQLMKGVKVEGSGVEIGGGSYGE